MRRLCLLIAAVAVSTGLLVPGPTMAAFPGANGRIVFVTEEPGKPVIASMASDGSDVQLLTQADQSPSEFGDENPRWSPGGTLIVFTRYDAAGYGDIWVMSANGTGQKRLTNSFEIDDDWASFSADGSRIVFTSDRHGNYEIYSMTLAGTGVTRLTNDPAVDWLPAWSPNNDRIAFSSDRRTGISETWTMNPDGSGLSRETTAAGEGDFDQVWSSDGTYVYFTRLAADFSGDIWRVDVATNAAGALQTTAADEFQPASAPDQGTASFYYIFTTLSQGVPDIAYCSSQLACGFLTSDYDFDSYMPDWQPVPEFPLVDARFSSFEDDIAWAYDNDITTGCSAERFCPDNSVTREQMASFLVRALGLSGTPPDAFTDDETSSHEANINLLAAAGITTGCGPGLFCPKDLVKRDQMASFISRAFDLPATATDYFTDDETSSHEANINRLRAAGITTGCTATTYCPSGVVTRGQMAAFLHRAVE